MILYYETITFANFQARTKKLINLKTIHVKYNDIDQYNQQAL